MHRFKPTFLKIDNVCPNCGKQNNLSIAVENKLGKAREYYECNCGWEGSMLVSKGEWKNIKRTKLIDEMTKMIKMTSHI